MNKQEAIEKIEKILLLPTDDVDPSYDLGYNNGLRKAKSIIEKIEPEKPVVPQFVADWIEVCKEHLTTSLYTAMNPNFMKENSQSFDFVLWIKKTSNQDIFARAWLDGYEVEEEKLYTARLKITTISYVNYINRRCADGAIILSDLNAALGNYQTSFTQSELEELNVWDNPAFEIEEVE